MKVRVIVELELEAPDLESVEDLVHGVFEQGDPGDTLNACVIVTDARQLEHFSWESQARP